MSRARHFPTLGFDPTPGDVHAARTVAATTKSTAQALQEIADVLTGSAGGEWRGKAAIAFRDLLDDDFKPKVVKAAHSFDDAARVLDHWVSRIESFQSRTTTLEERARQAKERARNARHQAALVHVPPVVLDDPTSVTARDEAVRERERLQTDAGSADSEVDAARRDAASLESDYTIEGRTAASQLKDAMDAAPNEPGFWDKLGNGIMGALDKIGDAIGDLGDMATDFLAKIAPLLKVIGDIASLLSTVCALLAFIPILTPIMGPAALALGVVALGAHYLSAVGTTGSFLEALTNGDVLWDAAGVVLGGATLKYGKTLTRGVYRAARANGNTYRVVTTAGGRRMHVPLKLFDAVRRETYVMSTREKVLRTVEVSLSGADKGVTGKGVIVDGVYQNAASKQGPLPKIFSGNWGPLINQRPALSR